MSHLYHQVGVEASKWKVLKSTSLQRCTDPTSMLCAIIVWSLTSALCSINNNARRIDQTRTRRTCMSCGTHADSPIQYAPQRSQSLLSYGTL